MSLKGTFLNFEELLAPIAGENSAGRDLSFENTYEQIETARSADDDLERGQWQRGLKTADWHGVIKLSKNALTRESKDLKIAIWLTEALSHTAGIEGLKEGLCLIRELLNAYWDNLYPEIEDGDLEFRSIPLEWLNQNLSFSIKQTPVSDAAGHEAYHLLDVENARRVEQLKSSSRKEEQDAFKALDEREKKLSDNIDKAVTATEREYYEDLQAEVEACLQALDELDEAVEEKFGDERPGFTVLRRSLDEFADYSAAVLRKKPPKTPPPPPVSATDTDAPNGNGAASITANTNPEGGVPASSMPGRDGPVPNISPAPAAGAAPVPGNHPAGGTQAMPPAPPDEPVLPQKPAETLDSLICLARHLLSQSPESPVPYLIARAIRWGEVWEKGPEPGKIELPPPSTETRRKLKQLYQEKKWNDLRLAAEESALNPEGRGWLDVQRYVLEALQQGGNRFQPAASALKATLGAFLSAYDKLPEMELSDGTPVAGNDTREWLAGEFFSAPTPTAAMAAAETPPAATAGNGAPDPYPEALARVKAGQFAAGISLLNQAAAEQTCERNRMLGKLQTAELCLSANRADLARPILDELVEMSATYRLAHYEDRELNVRLWKTVYECCRQDKQPTENVKQQMNHAFDKLCQLDVAQAFVLGKP